ncbi:MBL fold metallo-hydrolase, partial [Streptomyces antimycoticus]|uniref:MBL fold metallo-hydrolase n=1 Tax=Streptomyces antimycoticus TaxID=68175 RepID=UPI0036CF3AE2
RELPCRTPSARRRHLDPQPSAKSLINSVQALAPARSGILITGDALVTAHPTSRISGPQLLPDMFHTDRARALDSLVLIESLDADLVLPGHGPVHHGSAKEAALTAREHAAR